MQSWAVLGRKVVGEEEGFGVDRKTVGHVDKEVFYREGRLGRHLDLEVVFVLEAAGQLFAPGGRCARDSLS